MEEKKPKYETITDYHNGEFSRLHIEGGDRFGGMWLNINQLIGNAVMGLVDFDFRTPANKHALSKVAFAICEQLERQNKGGEN